jgi:hypothetical protein
LNRDIWNFLPRLDAHLNNARPNNARPNNARPNNARPNGQARTPRSKPAK